MPKRTHNALAHAGIFFYDQFYHLDASLSNGWLEEIPLPGFSTPEWPLPCSTISEAYQCKLFHEV